jgi:hypothetical protein
VSTLNWRAIGWGALAGLLVIVPLTALRAVLDHQIDNFDDSAWVPLFAIALFGAYVVAGVIAGRRTPETPLSNGLLAGVGALALWLPLRILIWVARGESQGLFSGSDPVFTATQLFGQVIFAAVFGLVGGLIGARMTRTTTPTNDPAS